MGLSEQPPRLQLAQIIVGVLHLVAAWQQVLHLQDVVDLERCSRVPCRAVLQRVEAEQLLDDRSVRRVVGPDGLGHGPAGQERTFQQAHKAHRQSVFSAREGTGGGPQGNRGQGTGGWPVSSNHEVRTTY